MGSIQEVQTLTTAASTSVGERGAESSGALLELVKVLRRDKELYEAK